MEKKEQLNSFISKLGTILHQSNPFPGKATAIEVLINPRAGSLQSSKKRKSIIKEMDLWLKNQEAPVERGDINVRVHITESVDHAQLRAVQLVEDLYEDRWADHKILLLAGGDGFHKDICTALMRKSPDLFQSVYLFRLPLGTGNDGSDCSSLTEALHILKGPVKEIKKSCLSIQPKGLKEDFSFNIASLGLDAYVCVLTEKWKGRLPGDIYKIMVDLSILFYDRKYPIRESILTIEGPKGEIQVQGPMLLTVMGAHGNSTYGGKKKILPDDNNLLLTDKVSLMKRIQLKGHFMKGTHKDFSCNNFYTAHKIIIEYPESLLMQLDGEVTPLSKENFPLTLTRIDGIIKTFTNN